MGKNQMSKNSRNTSHVFASQCSNLKRQAGIIEETKPKKKRKVGNPNPLSCLKKKPKKDPLRNVQNKMESEGKKKKRIRKRKNKAKSDAEKKKKKKKKNQNRSRKKKKKKKKKS